MPTIKIPHTIKVAARLPVNLSTKKKKKQQRKPIHLRIEDKYKIKDIYTELDSSPFVKIINIVKVKEFYKIIKLEDKTLFFKQVRNGKIITFNELTVKDKDDFLSDFKSFLEEYLNRTQMITIASAPPKERIRSIILTDKELEELLQSFED